MLNVHDPKLSLIREHREGEAIAKGGERRLRFVGRIFGELFGGSAADGDAENLKATVGSGGDIGDPSEVRGDADAGVELLASPPMEALRPAAEALRRRTVARPTCPARPDHRDRFLAGDPDLRRPRHGSRCGHAARVPRRDDRLPEPARHHRLDVLAHPQRRRTRRGSSGLLVQQMY